MKRYSNCNGKMTIRHNGQWVKASEVLGYLQSIELTQQTCNASPSCPVCDGMSHIGGHLDWCWLGIILAANEMNSMEVAGGEGET